LPRVLKVTLHLTEKKSEICIHNHLTMRTSLLSLPFALIVYSCSSGSKDGEFELTGNFSNANGETIYLEKLASAQPVIVDSAVLDEKGGFQFSGYTPRIGFYRIKQNQQNFAMLVLDSADKVKVSGNLKDLGNTYKVEGSKETRLFMEYNEIAKKRDLRLDSLNKLWQSIMESRSMDSKRMDSLSKVFEAPYNNIVESSNQEMIKKIDDNADMYSSIMAVQALEPDKYPDIYRKLDIGLTKKFPNDNNVKMFHDVVSKIQATTIGQLAPEINLPSPAGENIALSSLKGKIVLVDFWASWCGPCRKEMPNVVKAYKKYKDKGFEIFGVSLDQDKDKWVEAIKKDEITWPQVSDLRQWKSEAARIYNVQGIPYTVLLDKEGRIIAKNLRGEELDKKLAEVLN
jgi:peroxiredoxin